MLTSAVEDYLKAIYEIGRERDKVTTSSLAEYLGVSPASVTGMIKKLDELKLISYERYQGVQLSEAGRKIALEVIRHHRLVELYLSEAMGVPWDQVHDEAEKWEHVLSENLEDRMDEILGHPTVDPHGSPIPNRQGEIEEIERTALSELSVGDKAVIAEVHDRDPDLLRYFGGMGLYPEERIEVIAFDPFDGPIRLLVDGEERILGREAARHIYVTQIESAVEQS